MRTAFFGIIATIFGIGAGILLHPIIYPTPATTPTPVTPAPATVAAEPEKEQYPPPSLEEASSFTAIIAPPLPEQKPLKNPQKEEYVLQLFAPSNEQVEAQQSENQQAQKLEQMMVMAYLLTNCSIIQQHDYEHIYQALVRYLQAEHGEEALSLAKDAASKARASYQLVYRYVPCDDPSLRDTAASLLQWQEQMQPVQVQRAIPSTLP